MAEGNYIRYVDWSPSQESLQLVQQANQIIEEYERRGLSLTLRQLYYQFVARGLLSNVGASYDRLGTVVSQGRLAGLISWDAIEDRTRQLKGLGFHEGPADAIRRARETYRIDLWEDQPCRPEVWIEKIALENVISGICNELRVDYFSSRGYNSQSEQWAAGRRFARYVRAGQRPIVFHLGDHDPEGVDMTRDNRERLEMFAGVPVQVVRLALNMEQIERYRPPPNFVKPLSSRAAGYRAQFRTEECWELDALDPAVLRDLIRDAVWRVRDVFLWDRALAREADDLRYLDGVVEESTGGMK